MYWQHLEPLMSLGSTSLLPVVWTPQPRVARESMLAQPVRALSRALSRQAGMLILLCLPMLLKDFGKPSVIPETVGRRLCQTQETREHNLRTLHFPMVF